MPDLGPCCGCGGTENVTGLVMLDFKAPNHHMWAWPLSEVDVWAPPVPCRGFQGFWPSPWPLPLPDGPDL